MTVRSLQCHGFIGFGWGWGGGRDKPIISSIIYKTVHYVKKIILNNCICYVVKWSTIHVCFKIMFLLIYVKLSLPVGCFKSHNAIQCVIYKSGQKSNERNHLEHAILWLGLAMSPYKCFIFWRWLEQMRFKLVRSTQLISTTILIRPKADFWTRFNEPDDYSSYF